MMTEARSVLGAVLVLAAASGARGAAPVEPERRSAVVRAVERAGPSIVNISTARIVHRSIDPFFEFRDRFFDDMFRDFFQRHSRAYVQNSLGSGVVISPDGYILTNAHVVMRAAKIRVTLPNKEQFAARLINVDAKHDLALLKIAPGRPLKVVPMGTSSDLMIGETTIAIGNPFGLENSVTTGVISAKNRSIRAANRDVFSGLLQTDAAINPGNSGGALLNIKGELIGINTAIRAGAEGIGFAIPADAAWKTACVLLDYGVLKRIRVGIKTARGARGVRITGVEPDSPAAAARLKAGDEIVQIGGQPVKSQFCLHRLIIAYRPGDTVAFGIRKRNGVAQVNVTLGLVPEPLAHELARRKLGIQVQDLTRDLGAALDMQEGSGVVIAGVQRGSPAHAAGLQRSDVIVYIGRHRLQNVRALGVLLKAVGPNAAVAVIFVRNRRLYRATIRSR